MISPRLFLIRLSLKPDTYQPFLTWFAIRHAPALIECGFYSANSFLGRSTSQQTIFNLHEIPGAHVFESEMYRDLVLSDSEFKTTIIPTFEHRSNTIYRQVAQLAQGSVDADIRFPTTSNVAIFSIEDFDSEISAISYFESMISPHFSTATGFAHARLCTKDGEHPSGPSSEANWIVISEWTSATDANAFSNDIFMTTNGPLQYLEVGTLAGRLRSPKTTN
ncbi:MAG: hypothetical protein WCI10_05780 [Actinomycetota bacterium]